MRFCLPLLALAALSLPARAAHPSVVLIVADDLGYGELGCYGQKKIRTPNLDRMAKEGTRFTNFYAGSPVCAPSRCCLMTGKHGGHAHVRNNKEVRPEGQAPLPVSETMLTELAAKHGLPVGCIGKWGLGPPGSSGDPLKRGVSFFFGYNCQRHAHSHYPKWVYRNAKKVELDNDGKKGKQHTMELFEKEAVGFLDANKGRAFFLYLPFTVPHVAIQAEEAWMKPYKALRWDDPPYDGKKGYQPHPAPRAGYAAMISRLDATVGKVLDKLKELKRDKDTLVIFTSDNGATHDAGGADTKFFNSTGGLRGRKGSVYEGGIRVPLIAWQPGTVRAGVVSPHVAYFPDLMPTALEALGATARVPRGIDGISFLPALRGAKQTSHDYLYWEFAGYGGQQAVRQGDWKALRRDLNKGKKRLVLYNLRTDPREEDDVAAKRADIARKLQRILDTARVPSKEFPLKGADG